MKLREEEYWRAYQAGWLAAMKKMGETFFRSQHLSSAPLMFQIDRSQVLILDRSQTTSEPPKAEESQDERLL